jgi:hypothetical protein
VSMTRKMTQYNRHVVLYVAIVHRNNLKLKEMGKATKKLY